MSRPSPITNLLLRFGGLALTVTCWVWASGARLSEPWSMGLIWAAPLLAFPITRLGRRVLDADPRPQRAARVTIAVHYGMMIALGSSLFRAFGVLLRTPPMTVPVLRQVVWALVLLTGFATLLTVLNLALRGLGAPFAAILSKRLATDWLYARTRNPMLLCTLAWFLCLGVWHQTLWFVLLIAVSVAPAWIYFVKVYEERELEIRFGTKYEQYRAQTPFFFSLLVGRLPGL